jgi:thioesterase domain-containing protein
VDDATRQALIDGAPKVIPFIERTGLEVLDLDRGWCRVRVPLEPNVNHVGTMYAGALFTLAEFPGGLIFLSAFDAERYYPVVKDLQIRFRRPATTDVTVEVRITDEEVARIQAAADDVGKADYAWDCDLVDAHGEVVATTHNVYQLRRHGT